MFNNVENDSFLLGVLLNVTGLSKADITKIANMELILDSEKTPMNIRNFILEDSQIKQTLLRKLCNIGIDLNSLSSWTNLAPDEIRSNVDNNFYYFNMIDFKMKSSREYREKMIDLLLRYGLKSKEISEILDIAYTTVRGYARG